MPFPDAQVKCLTEHYKLQEDQLGKIGQTGGEPPDFGSPEREKSRS